MAIAASVVDFSHSMRPVATHRHPEMQARVTSTFPSQPEQTLALRFGRTTVSVVTGDLLATGVQAVVVPANRRGMMVAGAAGQARLRGGFAIEHELMRQAPLTLGTSVATTSGDLAADGTGLVLHAVVFDDLGGATRLDLVERALEAALASADRHRVRSIAIPPVGAGVGEGRLRRADVFAILVGVVAAHLRRYPSRIDRIELVCGDPREAREVHAMVQDAHTLWWRMKTSDPGK
jgi:O-acetyl-ADP-ribose deacetylase (regulator of RNase III)